MFDFGDLVTLLALLVAGVSILWGFSQRGLNVRVEIRKVCGEIGARVATCNGLIDDNEHKAKLLRAAGNVHPAVERASDQEYAAGRRYFCDCVWSDVRWIGRKMIWKFGPYLEEELGKLHRDMADVDQLLAELEKEGETLDRELVAAGISAGRTPH